MKNIKLYNATIKAYILDAIEMDADAPTDKEKLQYLYNTFMSEAYYPDALKRHGNLTNVFTEWSRGLPSTFNIAVSNYDIMELLKSWDVITDETPMKKQDAFIENYWNYMSNRVFTLMSRAGVKYA